MRFNHTVLGVSLLAAFSSGSALASGYHFGSQSASAQGTANANAAQADDASVLFYNPAGISRLKGLNVSGVLDLVLPSGSFEDRGTVTVLGLPTGGSDGGKFIRNTAVPHAYMTKSLTDQLTFGFGAFVPFGSKSSYDPNWVGRYNIISTELQTLALNPTLSFKLNPKFSFGAGLTAQYIHGALSKGTDFGSGALASVIKSGVSLPSSLIASVSGNPLYSGQGRFSGKDWGVGFNLGLMYEPVEGTRFGLAYRSKISHQLSGNAEWDVTTATDNLATKLNAVVAGLGTKIKNTILATYTNSESALKVDTPESLSASVYHEVGALALMADITRTRHSRFQELRIDFLSNSQPDSTTPERWTDTTRVSLGVSYKLNQKFKLSGGFAVDQSPVNDSNRTASIPDNKRTWYSAGLNWKIDENRSVDVAYSYINIASGDINNFDNGGQVTAANVPTCNTTANTSSCATIKGRYTLNSSLVGLQFNQRF